jgi:hypothetical protein
MKIIPILITVAEERKDAGTVSTTVFIDATGGDYTTRMLGWLSEENLIRGPELFAGESMK